MDYVIPVLATLFVIYNRKYFRIVLTLLKVLFTVVFMRFSNLFSNVKQVSTREYDISYSIGVRKYKFKLKTSRIPRKVIQVLDGEDEEDITDEVCQYLGPNEDCHGQALTPSDLGYNELVFFTASGEEIVIPGDTPISL